MARKRPDKGNPASGEQEQVESGSEEKTTANPFYGALRARTHSFDAKDLAALLKQVDQHRYQALSRLLAEYVGPNLLATIKKKGGIANYRINPYVLMASASAMNLSDPVQLANFIFNNKLYAGLETSFGKSLEKLFLTVYPIGTKPGEGWDDPPEKKAEAEGLKGLSREEKARHRVNSVWREIDRSCVVGKRRYLVSVKSGPNCINDTQVQGMTDAIAQQHQQWLDLSHSLYPGVKELDIVIGITYGTDRTTNNKENQILAKLLGRGFAEEDRVKRPGVLVNVAKAVRVYRCVGQDFWAFVGNPVNPATAQFVFIETLLAVAKGLSSGFAAVTLQDEVNAKLAQLSEAFKRMVFPQEALPQWATGELTRNEGVLLSTALTAFYDQGI